jgi:hypothetical protein
MAQQRRTAPTAQLAAHRLTAAGAVPKLAIRRFLSSKENAMLKKLILFAITTGLFRTLYKNTKGKEVAMAPYPGTR